MRVSVSENWLKKTVSVSVSENFVTKESLGFGFAKFGLEKSLSFDSENLVREKSFGFGKFVPEKKVFVSVLENLVSEYLVSEKKKSK